jgi:hypothetical protein
MKIGPAHSAGTHLDENLARPWRGPRDFLNPKGLPNRS